MTGPGDHQETGRGPLFWAALVAGWAIMAFGIVGVLTNTRDTRPVEWARWFLGAAVAHDGLLAPAVLVAGWAVGRLLPGPVRAPVQGGLIVMGVVALFAFPLVRGYGVRPDNPTVVFRNYTPPLLVVLATVSILTVALAILAWRRRPPSSQGEPHATHP
jgi:hypothetical protein